MARTAKQIQGDVLRLLKRSDLANDITGKCYREGMRPRDSKKEDAVVIFSTGDTEQVETGFVYVNVYFPDICPWDDGVMTEDGERGEELELLAQQWADSLKGISFYQFDQAGAIHTQQSADTSEHFVVIRIKYRYLGSGSAEMTINS